jgi:nucleoside-diphosphate-sugar epimerase
LAYVSAATGQQIKAVLFDTFDRALSPDTRARFILTDLTDYGQVVEAFSGIDEVHGGVDAVVHLAAIPGAGFAPNVTTFDNNLLSAFHVLQAAGSAAEDPQRGLGVQRDAARLSVRQSAGVRAARR